MIRTGLTGALTVWLLMTDDEPYLFLNKIIKYKNIKFWFKDNIHRLHSEEKPGEPEAVKENPLADD